MGSPLFDGKITVFNQVPQFLAHQISEAARAADVSAFLWCGVAVICSGFVSGLYLRGVEDSGATN